MSLYIFGGEVIRGFTFTMIFGRSDRHLFVDVHRRSGPDPPRLCAGGQPAGREVKALIGRPHLPSHAAIEAYGDGGFRFAGMSHSGSLLILPSGIHGWRPAAVTDITSDDLAPILAEKTQFTFLLIGTGRAMVLLPQLCRAISQGRRRGRRGDGHGGRCAHLQHSPGGGPAAGRRADCGMSIQAGATAYCRDIVHRHDKDRYLASLFVPEDKRPHLWALYAFNYEIARVRETITQPLAGEVRLQWWSEALGSLDADGSAEHPVLGAISAAVKAGSLPIPALIGLIEARRFDLYDDPMPTLTELEGYLGETSSMLIQLASMILAGADAAMAAGGAGYAGVAYGLAGLLRALPLQRARGQCFVPRDLLALEGLQPRTCTQRHSYGDLSLPRGRARKQEIGDVCTSDQQD